MGPQQRPVEPGELAGRIAERRERLGLTPAELAERAGMDVAYLEYLERRAGAAATGAAMARLAVALGTTLPALAGWGPAPAGPGSSEPALESLDRAECRARLAAGAIGRVVYLAPTGPVAYPVNYTLESDRVVFSTSPALASEVVAAGRVAFEVDEIDEATAEGWSVLVSGEAQPAGWPACATGSGAAPGADVPEHAPSLPARPVSWAGSDRDSAVAIRLGELSGRVIVHRQPSTP